MDADIWIGLGILLVVFLAAEKFRKPRQVSTTADSWHPSSYSSDWAESSSSSDHESSCDSGDSGDSGCSDSSDD